MKAFHALISRNALRWLIAFAALGGVQVGHASTYSVERQARIWESFQGVFDRPNSVVLDLKYPRSGSAIPTSSPAGSTPLGKMGVTQAGTGVRVVGNVAVPLGDTGKVAAGAAGAGISRAAFIRGLGAAFANPLVGVGLLVAAPVLSSWIESGGVRINPNGTTGQPFLKADPAVCSVAPCYNYRANSATYLPLSKTKEEAAQLFCAHGGLGGGTVIGTWIICSGGYRRGLDSIAVLPSSASWLPASFDDIAPYLDRPEAPALTPQAAVEGITKAGIDPFGAEAPVVTVTGPSSVPGARSQTSTQTKVIPGTTTEVGPGYSGETQPATRTTTQAATHNVTYNDNRVTYNTTNNTTTTVTNNVTGATESAVQQEITEEDGETECQKNPESLACADLDTPDGEIPKSTASVTYQVEDTFGSGSCPADVYGTINGQSVKLYDYAQTCNYVSMYVRPMLLVLCALGALFIVMPGKADS